MDEKEKVFDKIKKMLAKANDAATTENEREIALRMVHNTLAKHNLTMAEAELATHRSQEKRTGLFMHIREYAWMRRAGIAIGTLFFCEFLVQHTEKKHANYIFVGKESNANTALLMAKYVIESINKEGAKQAVAMGETPRGTYWRGFCKGAVYRLHQRCLEIKASAEKAPPVMSTGTSLVLASVYALENKANQEYLATLDVKIKNSKNKQKEPDLTAFHSGMRYANEISLNTQIESKTS